MDSFTLGKINGFLLAFEHLNAGYNHAPTYTLQAIPWRGDPATSLRDHFCSSLGSGEGSWEVALQPIAEGTDALPPLLHRWLFDQYLGLPAGNEADLWQAKREMCVQALMALVAELLEGQSPRVWKVDARPTDGSFYEIFWDDLALEAGTRLFLLHLGMSD